MFAKQESNGKKGETRTEAILLDKFWVWRRSVDIEGADFILQIPSESLTKLTEEKSTFQGFGIIQAKFFEGKNQVRIKKEYVRVNGITSIEFSTMLHTDDEFGNHHYYYFTAEEIVKEFYLDKKGGNYCFSISKKHKYEKYKNIKHTIVLKTIYDLILRAREIRNSNYISNLFRIFSIPTMHFEEEPDFTYKLVFIEKNHIFGGHPVVLCLSNTSGHKHLLEYRRDLFGNQGNFAWGYKGTGPQFLSYCLLAHHFNGEGQSSHTMMRLLNNLISILDESKEHEFTSSMISDAISEEPSSSQ